MHKPPGNDNSISLFLLAGCLSVLLAFLSPYGFATDLVHQLHSSLIINENSVADAAANAAPAIVNLEIIEAPPPTAQPLAKSSARNVPFNPFSEKIPDRRPSGPPWQNRLLGAGLIVRPDGYIATNCHLVAHAQAINVTLHDQRSFKGRVVGKDAFADLAVIKIDAEHLPTVPLALGKKLRAGDWAIAVGSPYGEDQTVSLGVINALGRTVTDGSNRVQLIQTDARMNGADSGGPLLNIHGEVIGLASVLRDYAPNGGFAVPIDVVNQTVNDLIKHGSIARPYLGFFMRDVNTRSVTNSRLPPPGHNVLIGKVIPLGPADKCGIKTGDYIVKVGEKAVKSVKDVRSIVRERKPGDVVQISLARKGTTVVKRLTIGTYPSDGSWEKP